jgi:BASS family bile acid:Na+ symporter
MDAKQIILLALQASIFLTVFSFGLEARFSDILSIVRRPGMLARALLAMFVIMPLVAVLMVSSFDLRPPVKVVLVALSVSPIPPLFPRQASMAGGRRAFTLGLLDTAALLSIVVVPLALVVLKRYFNLPLAMPFSAVAGLALKTVLLPMLAGMVFHAVAPAVAERIAKPISTIATVLLAAGSLVILFVTARGMWTLIGNGTILAMAAFAALGLLTGHLLGGPDPHERSVLALSTAVRHPGIALALATANFPNQLLQLPGVLLYVLVGAMVCIPYAIRQGRRVAATAPTA